MARKKTSSTHDLAFDPNKRGLELGLSLLLDKQTRKTENTLPKYLVEQGIGETAALQQLAPLMLSGSAALGADTAFAHMDPPTPWITWVINQWTSSLNQNLLHPDTAPQAIGMERIAIDWLAPVFGMSGGHMTAGSTLANLTALWAARETVGIQRVVASDQAHLSVRKSAHLLGLTFESVKTDAAGRLDAAHLPTSLDDACLVLTAGTTSSGSVDPLDIASAAWTHIDAAWGGPLCFSETYGKRLRGIESADSVSVSAHKWLFQPKTSALVLFRDVDRAHRAVSFEGEYLATPNVGILGSRGAIAGPLVAMLLAWGKHGVAERIDRCMEKANTFAAFVADHPQLTLFAEPVTGVVNWRAKNEALTDRLVRTLPTGSVSTTNIQNQRWLRNVAANPNADITLLYQQIEQSLANP